MIYLFKKEVAMPKQKFTTTLDSKLLEEIKIQAIKEKRSVSEILEEIIKIYLSQKSGFTLNN